MKFSINKPAVIILKSVMIMVFFLLFGGGGIYLGWEEDLPDLQKVANYNPDFFPGFTTVYSKDNKVIGRIGSVNREIISIHEIPDTFIRIVTAVEDQQFFTHHGINVRGFVRAVLMNLRNGKIVQGGSGITQQLARQLFLKPEKSFMRKIKEAFIAVQLEKYFSKKKLLELYLNKIYFGSGSYGIKAAAKLYFNKDVKNLTIGEMSLLAGMIKAPTVYNPISSIRKSKERHRQVLSILRHIVYFNNINTEKIYHTFWTKNRNFPEKRCSSYNRFPVIENELKKTVSKLLGNSLWFNRRLALYTYIEPDLQEIERNFLESKLNKLNEKGSIYDYGILSMERYSNRILAIVGGRYSKNREFNVINQGYRQPGSLFKLFIYITALKDKYSVSSIVDDKPVNLKVKNQIWHPKNYKNRYYYKVTLQTAFARSLNSAAVQLGLDVGLYDIRKVARKMGISTPLPAYPSLLLGAIEVIPEEIITAYSVVANNGNLIRPVLFSKIADFTGEVLFVNTPSIKKKVLPENLVRQTAGLLNSVVVNGTARSAISDKESCGKTGTTNNNRDAWYIGYDANQITGIWIGCNKKLSCSQKKFTGSDAARIWNKIITAWNERRKNNVIKKISSNDSFSKFRSGMGVL